MIVAKLGGTSIADANSMRLAGDIILKKTIRPTLVVLSACAGITDKLQQLVKFSAERDYECAYKIINIIETHHFEMVPKLLRGSSLESQALDTIKSLLNNLRKLAEGVSLLGEYTLQTIDSMSSFGELLSSRIFYYYLLSQYDNVEFFDIREVLKTDENYTNANVLEDRSKHYVLQLLKPVFDTNDIVVTQGFIASSESGKFTTIGRGGSDYSASLLGGYLNASEIQIWTDADGIMTADPKIVENAKTIDLITYSAIKELSYFGAKILHPSSIKPAILGKIPVKVLNTFNSSHNGTLIFKDIPNDADRYFSLVIKEKCWYYKFEFNGDSSFIFVILSNLIKNDIKPLFIIGNVNQLHIIFDRILPEENEEIISKKSGATITRLNRDIILITNNNSNRRFDINIDTLIKSRTFDFDGIYYFVHYSSAIILTPISKGQDVLISLHNELIQ